MQRGFCHGLLEQGILEELEARGFEPIPFEDRSAYRFAYESHYRSRWVRDALTDLVVVRQISGRGNCIRPLTI